MRNVLETACRSSRSTPISPRRWSTARRVVAAHSSGNVKGAVGDIKWAAGGPNVLSIVADHAIATKGYSTEVEWSGAAGKSHALLLGGQLQIKT